MTEQAYTIHGFAQVMYAMDACRSEDELRALFVGGSRCWYIMRRIENAGGRPAAMWLFEMYRDHLRAKGGSCAMIQPNES